MPVPAWIAQVNKRLFNKVELKRGVRPVLTHVGTTRVVGALNGADVGADFLSGLKWCRTDSG